MARFLSQLMLLTLISDLVAQERLLPEEPAILISTGVYYTNTTEDYIILTCTAYGNPLPDVEWTVTSDYEDYSSVDENSGSFTTTQTEILTDLGYFSNESLVSILIICDSDIDDMAAVDCSTSNGICAIDSIGYQRARFDIMDNFSIEVFLDEGGEFCFTTDENQPSATLEVTPPTVNSNFRTIVISVTVTVCVLLISLAAVTVVCFIAIALHKRKSKSDVTMVQMESTSRAQRYNNLRNRPPLAPPSAPSVSPAAVYTKPDSRYCALLTTQTSKSPDVGYSNLRFDWSKDFGNNSLDPPYQEIGLKESVRTRVSTTANVAQPDRRKSTVSTNLNDQDDESMTYCNAYRLQSDYCKDDDVCPLPPSRYVNSIADTATHTQTTHSESRTVEDGICHLSSPRSLNVKSEKSVNEGNTIGGCRSSGREGEVGNGDFDTH